MKVVLLKDLKIGQRFTVKEVADGFARQVLIPRGEAKMATPDAIKWAEAKRAELKSQQAGEESLAEAIKTKLAGLTVEIKEKAGPEGQLFSKVAAKEIASALRGQSVNLNESAIEVPTPIKHLGLHQVKARLTGGREAGFTVLVTKLEA